jgi:hypothetical protein
MWKVEMEGEAQGVLNGESRIKYRGWKCGSKWYLASKHKVLSSNSSTKKKMDKRAWRGENGV